MNYTLRFRPEVVIDLEGAARWYDERRTGLGAEFLRETRETLDRIAQQPELVAAEANGIRSVRLHRFPYLVHFRMEGTTVVVFAVMFGGRDPSSAYLVFQQHACQQQCQHDAGCSSRHFFTARGRDCLVPARDFSL